MFASKNMSLKTHEEDSTLKEAVQKKTAGHVLDDALSKLVVGLAIIAGVLTFVMVLVICYSVIGRAFFKQDVAWVLELCEYLIYIDVMLAVPWVLKIDKHVRVDIVHYLISPKAQKVLNILLEILGFVMCGWFFYYSVNVLIDAIQSGHCLVRVIPIKKWLVVQFLPLMSGLCAIIFVRRLIVYLTHKDIQTAADYAAFEQAKMNPKYSISQSMELTLPSYDDLSDNTDDVDVSDQEDERKEGVNHVD